MGGGGLTSSQAQAMPARPRARSQNSVYSISPSMGAQSMFESNLWMGHALPPEIEQGNIEYKVRKKQTPS